MRWGLVAVVLLALFSGPCTSFAQDQKYEDLMKHLIDLKGWVAEPANGMEVGDRTGMIIIVMRDYHSGSKMMHTQIAVGKSSKKAWSQFEQGATVDNEDLFCTTIKASDHKIGIAHEKKSNTGSIVVPLNVKDGNAIFSLAFVGMAYEDALNIAKSFPWKDMETIIESR